MCILYFNHFGFRWEQLGRFIVKLGQLLGRAQVGFTGDQYVANADLVFIQGLLRVIRINELARIDNGKDGTDFQHTVERLGFQFVDNAGGVR